jgi:hypothetical protein
MATPIGTNVVTAISRRYIMPEIVDNIYNSNPIFFRLNKMNKRIVRGGTQIEVPLMYARFSAGGAYRGFDELTITPSDTIKNGAWDWKQYHVPVAVDGLTLIKTDSPQAIANFLTQYFAQAQMEMAELLGAGIWTDGVTNTKEIDGFKGAIDDAGVLTTYGGISRSTNTWWSSQDDSTSATLTHPTLMSMFGNCTRGGRHTTLIVSRQEQYNRYWNLNIVDQSFPVTPAGADEQLASAGFTNQLFNGVPWIVDSHVFDGPNSSNSAIVFLNEDFINFAVTPRADFYLQKFQTPVNQDAMAANLLWAGNLIVTNCARQGKLTNISG